MDQPAPSETKQCPNCGSAMHAISFATYLEERHLNPPLDGVQFPVMSRGPGWKCQNPNCGYFEPAQR